MYKPGGLAQPPFRSVQFGRWTVRWTLGGNKSKKQNQKLTSGNSPPRTNFLKVCPPGSPGAFNGRPDPSITHPGNWWLVVSRLGCKALNQSNWMLWAKKQKRAQGSPLRKVSHRLQRLLARLESELRPVPAAAQLMSRELAAGAAWPQWMAAPHGGEEYGGWPPFFRTSTWKPGLKPEGWSNLFCVGRS